MGASGASGSCSNGLSISSGVTASAAVKQFRIHSVRKRVLYIEWHVVMTYYYRGVVQPSVFVTAALKRK